MRDDCLIVGFRAEAGEFLFEFGDSVSVCFMTSPTTSHRESVYKNDDASEGTNNTRTTRRRTRRPRRYSTGCGLAVRETGSCPLATATVLLRSI